MIGDWTSFKPLLESHAVRALVERLSDPAGESVDATGLVDAGRGLVVSMLATLLRRRVLLVVPDDGAAQGWIRDLSAVAGLSGRDPRRVVLFPPLDADPYDAIAPHPEVVRERVVALGRVVRGDVDVLVAPVRALQDWLPSPAEWNERWHTIRVGDDLPPDRFVLDALAAGYRRVDIVSGPGEISRRGGIVDLFPPTADEPVRIELFGDTVDSLRAFDTDHQRSTGPLREVVFGPASENPPTETAVERLRTWLEAGASAAGDDESARRHFRRTLDALTEEGELPGFEALTALTAERPSMLFDHVASWLTVVDEPERTDDALLRADHEARRSYEDSGNRVLPPPARMRIDPRRVRERLEAGRLRLHELADGGESGDAVPFVTRTARAYSGRIPDLVADLRRVVKDDGRVLCVMRAHGGAERLHEILREYDLDAPIDDGGVAPTAAVTIRTGGLRTGFEFPSLRFTVLPERDVFGEQKRPAERKSRSRAAFVSDFRDLKVGDAVVHVDHGIAKYVGLGRPKGGSLNRDFIVLEFAAGDRLFVPVDRLDLVQKYTGAGGKKPSLDRLGGPGWERAKARVRRAVESMAEDLLELYAKRKAMRGTSIAPDTPWQQELEDAFPFELTEDQARAVDEVKRDMESDRPMDRLLVGDVGFGKTEVAVRAAFKAVMDGRQVALLAPTTVLVHQHEKTFRRRYAPFPVKVEAVSRFRSAAEVRDVVRRLDSGEVDVVIGTHRLLSKDVRFHQLGLLVVDEEQRFGVAHKERLKQLALGVDVLSMTATPIPRTLQMSLAGVRDLSMIETPPPGRTAIQTYLVPWRKNVLAQAIRQEMRREGQVFVVHNRIETLPALARAIQELVPEARVVVAHGQMGERRLERVMVRFVDHDADVLITTTIVENGLDIPRANTIVVNRADRFGLAQLYQLRGRVGRSARHAYCYFVIPGRQHLSEDAHRRLRALQEFSDLGAGFRLAAADLEIRGAGELLGPKQHGHIAALGFDLYTQMLERAVRERQGEEVVDRPPVTLHLGVDIKVPESYLAEAGDRLALYKRLAGARDGDDVDRLEAETEDRYGQLPPAGRNLFAMTRLRIEADRVRARSVDIADGRIQIRLGEDSTVDPERLVALIAKRGGSLTPSGLLLLPAPDRATDRIRAVRDVLGKIA
jgi:transcription-repair coupling factor (superfamily II helicase)